MHETKKLRQSVSKRPSKISECRSPIRKITPIIRMKIPSFIDLNMAWKSPACMRRQAGLGSLDVIYSQQWLLMCISPCHFSVQLLGLSIGKHARLTSLGDNPSCACNFFGYFIHMRDGELWLISTCT